MANTPSTDGFQWDDQKVRDFIEFGRRQHHISDIDYLGMDIEKFKAQASSGGASGKDWEIIQMISGYGILFDLKPNGKFASTEWPTEEFRLKEDLLENKYGKKYSIHSVRRISDQEVFSVGDEIGWGIVGNFKTTLLSFRINNEREGRLEFEYPIQGCGNVFCDFLDAIKLHKKASIPEPKKPLLITDDNIELYNNSDEIWLVYEDFSIYKATVGHRASRPALKLYSTEQAAQEYILLNKPVLNLQDVKTCFEEIIYKIQWSDSAFFNKIAEVVQTKIKEGRDK